MPRRSNFLEAISPLRRRPLFPLKAFDMRAVQLCGSWGDLETTDCCRKGCDRSETLALTGVRTLRGQEEEGLLIRSPNLDWPCTIKVKGNQSVSVLKGKGKKLGSNRDPQAKWDEGEYVDPSQGFIGGTPDV